MDDLGLVGGRSEAGLPGHLLAAHLLVTCFGFGLPQSSRDLIMDYLLVKFIWWVFLAFALGAFVGWYSCGRQSD